MTTIVLSSCFHPWNNPNEEELSNENIYYGSFSTQPKYLDPAKVFSLSEAVFINQIYEPPFQYHFLKRPYELIPGSATSIPKAEFLDENFHTLMDNDLNTKYTRFTINIRNDIKYQPHPAFVKQNEKYKYFFDNITQGKKYKTIQDFLDKSSRIATSDDFIYQIKRIADPYNSSPLIGIMSNYIVGIKQYAKWAKETRTTDQWLDLRSKDIAGIKKINNLAYSITIHGIYPQFLYWLSMHFFAPIPWEVDRFYFNPGFQKKNLNLNWNPIGTGPFMMNVNKPNKQIVLIKNPNFHNEYYPSEGSKHDQEKGFLNDAGKKIPFIDKIIFNYETSLISRWNKFMQGYYDRSGELHSNINTTNFDQALILESYGVTLTTMMKKHKIKLDKEICPSIMFRGFNMEDPVFGGYTKKQKKLRQAISIAIDTEEFINIFLNGVGQAAYSPIPPGIFGYQTKNNTNPYIYDWDSVKKQPKRKSINEAKSLLIEAGYPNGINEKTGKPLILHYENIGSESEPFIDWLKKKLININIQLDVNSTTYSKFQEKIRTGNLQFFSLGWSAAYPDPENILLMFSHAQLPKICKCSGANTTQYSNPEFNVLFEKIKQTHNSPERLSLINQSIQILQEDNPFIWGYHGINYYLSNEWVYNTKKHGISQGILKYIRIDKELRQKRQNEWNRPMIWPVIILLILIILLIKLIVITYKKRQSIKINT